MKCSKFRIQVVCIGYIILTFFVWTYLYVQFKKGFVNRKRRVVSDCSHPILMPSIINTSSTKLSDSTIDVRVILLKPHQHNLPPEQRQVRRTAQLVLLFTYSRWDGTWDWSSNWFVCWFVFIVYRWRQWEIFIWYVF